MRVKIGVVKKTAPLNIKFAIVYQTPDLSARFSVWVSIKLN